MGRSNVGKSSLLNALARKTIARTSAAPGKTRLANFYRVQRGNTPALFLVDLPGYGYARGGETSAREFDRLVDAYFARAGSRDAGLGAQESRPGARAAEFGSQTATTGSRGAHAGAGIQIGVLLLVDSRHPGLEADIQTWEWLRSQPCTHGVIGTKVDKLTRAERARHAREFETLFDIPVPLVSATTGEGLDELWKLIAKLPSQTAA